MLFCYLKRQGTHNYEFVCVRAACGCTYACATHFNIHICREHILIYIYRGHILIYIYREHILVNI